jgi:hypothetical protein
LLAGTAQASGLANRVFVSARSGNNANSCDNVNTPCQTLAGAVAQVNANGEVIVLDSGGYGPVTITRGLTIEAPAGVTAFIHPASGDAVTVNAGSSDTVTLRGLILNGGVNNGITVNSVGILNVESCFLTEFTHFGILMLSAGRLNVKGTAITACNLGLEIANSSGLTQASIDHCHLDGNFAGYEASTTSPGSSTTRASFSTADGNTVDGWVGAGGSGQDVLNLEFCSGSENGGDGLFAGSTNAQSVARFSNCVFANNGSYGVARAGGTLETRGNNTITGNGITPTFGTIGTFSPM